MQAGEGVTWEVPMVFIFICMRYGKRSAEADAEAGYGGYGRSYGGYGGYGRSYGGYGGYGYGKRSADAEAGYGGYGRSYGGYGGYGRSYGGYGYGK